MNRASRNRVLMVGGALIAIALLLVCGPLEGRFGRGGGDESPGVAAGPPSQALGVAVEMAVASAAAGAAIGESVVYAVIAREAERDVVADAAVGVSAAEVVDVAASDVAAAVAESSAVASGGAGSSGSTLPPVSAGGAITTLAAAQANAPPAGGAMAADRAFDSALAASAAGKVVDRFAPPVASGLVPSSLSLAAAQGFERGTLRQSCDTPGSDCRNIVSSGFVPPPVNGIGSGVRPGPGSSIASSPINGIGSGTRPGG